MEEYVIGLRVEGAGEAEAAASSADSLADSVDAAKAAANDAAPAFEDAASAAGKLADEADAATKAAKPATLNYGELEGALGKLGGPVGRLGQLGFGTADAFSKLGKNFSGAQVAAAGAAVGIGLIVVAIAAAAAAVGALIVKLVQMAITTSDAAAKAGILREAMTGSAANAAALSSTIASVATRVPLASSEVAKLGESLWKSGKRGKALEDALLAASYEAAGLGKNPGPELIARRMANLDVIGARLKDHIAAIFAGASTVDATSKFGRALSGFTELFNQNHSEGRALQKLLSVIVDPLINGLTALMPLATSIFRGMIMLALDVAIAVVSARNAILKMIPDDVKAKIADLASSQTVLNGAIEVGKWVMGLIAASLLVVAGVVGGVIIVIGGLIAVFAALVIGVAKAFVAIPGLVSGAIDALAGFASSGADAAANMVDGLVSGITSGTGAVVEAIRAMASSAVGAIKAALQIASPSRVFEGLGEFTGEGFAEGVDAQAATVQTSLEAMVAPPSPSAALDAGETRTPAMGGGASARPAVDLSGATITFNGVKDAETHGKAMLEEVLTMLIEGDALAEGAA